MPARHSIRIIAGTLKNRRLKAPTWDGLRPTADRLRETLFNILAPRVAGARVLDGYAGTGAIGIEALSRGAAHVAFAERDPRALALIGENLAHCGVSDRYAIIRVRLGEMPLSLPPGTFDLAVLDPPYDEPDLDAAVATIEPSLAVGGLVVLEHARRRTPPDAAGNLTRVRTVTSGDSALAFYERSHG